MKLLDFFQKYYRPKKLHGKSPRTVKLYLICFRAFGKSLGHDPELKDLTSDNVSYHMQRLLDNGRANATANRDRCCLVALWRYAVIKGMHHGEPEVPVEPEPIRVPQAWLKDDVDKLLEACHKCNGSIGDAPAWLFWQSMINVVLDTGERIGAVREIKWAWIERDSLLVPAEVRKGGKRDKWYRLSEHTCKLLMQLRVHNGKHESVFRWPYSETYIWNRFGKLLKIAGLPTGRNSKWHRLRKTTASVVHAAGFDATEALDHSNRKVTQRYLDPRFERQTQPAQILAGWLRRDGLNSKPTNERRQA